MEEAPAGDTQPGADEGTEVPRRRAGMQEKRSSRLRSASKKKGTSSRALARRKSKRSGYESVSSADSPLSSDAEDSDIDDIEVADESCRKVMQVETYRLQDRNPDHNQ